MESALLLCDMPLCRLCGEENANGTELYTSQENSLDLSHLVNKYLPLKIENDGKLPTKICPGCNIQLEATKSFMELIVEGQSRLRQLYKQQQDKLYRQEKQRQQLEEALKNVNPNSSVDTYTIQTDDSGQKFVILQIYSQGPLFPPGHELALKAEGLERPRRKRGRPPKPSPEEVQAETAVKAAEAEKKPEVVPEEVEATDGKRRRRVKAPSRYLEAIQGKELDKVLKQEGVIDEDWLSVLSDDIDGDLEEGESTKRVEEVIGRVEGENGEDLGQPIVINKALNRPRPRNKIGSGSQPRKRRKYRCEVCAKEFYHMGRYEFHKKLHNVQYTCTAPDCGFESGTRQELEAHHASSGHVGLSATEQVDQIGKLELPTKLPEENSIEEEVSALPDPSSSSSSPTKKDYTCEKCNKSFTCKQNYEVHNKAVHNGEKPFACGQCDKRFSYNNSLRIHMLRHAKGGADGTDNVFQYRCVHCPKSFRHPSSLLYHRDTEHANGRRFVCNKCNKPFKHRQLLQRHQLVHTDERPHKCNQCIASFKTRANLLHHSKTVHIGERNYWCSQCGKSFAHQTAFRLHQRWHMGIRPFECDFCQKSFSQKGNLAEHRRIHTGEKPYQCDHCGRAFTTSSQFNLHRKRHLDERPHKCEYCAKSFLHRITLRCHMRRHFDERPYKCTMCSKAFTEAWALKKHERTHTGEKPYKCEICSKDFSDSSNLSKHRRTHRNGKDKQTLYLYQKPEDDLINSTIYIDPQGSILEPSEIVNVADQVDDIQPLQLQQVVDQDGNAITFAGPDGQQIKVVTSSTDDGQENFQGLLPDGTLIPINLTAVDKEKSPNEDPLQNEKLDDLDGQLLDPNIQFLTEEDSSKLPSNIQFITEENQNMCLVTTYNIEDTINPQYLTIT